MDFTTGAKSYAHDITYTLTITKKITTTHSHEAFEVLMSSLFLHLTLTVTQPSVSQQKSIVTCEDTQLEAPLKTTKFRTQILVFVEDDTDWNQFIFRSF